jgi:group I intron endonuclease
MTKISGIYQIKNLVNGKVYVGSSENVGQRWKMHRILLCQQKHHSRHLQGAWNKYGEDNFEFKILEECSVEKLISFEQIWMDSLFSSDNRFGYNVNPMAASCLGMKHSEESKEKHRGENAPCHKLTWSQVREIREKYLSGKYRYEDLSKEYEVSQSSIGDIISNKCWKDGTLSEEYYSRIFNVASSSRSGVKNPRAKLTWGNVREVREKYLTGKYTYGDLSEEYGINSNNIRNIIFNRAWKDENLTEEYFQKISDMSIKRKRGENRAFAKLTWAKVREIREKYLPGKYTQRGLAKEYGISQGVVRRIITHKTWKEGPNDTPVC